MIVFAHFLYPLQKYIKKWLFSSCMASCTPMNKTLSDGATLELSQYPVSSPYAAALGCPAGSTETVLVLREHGGEYTRELTTPPKASHHLDMRYFHILYELVATRNAFYTVHAALRLATTPDGAEKIQETLDALIN